MGRRAIASDELEAANLNYWAYWIGEDRSTHHSDEFMAGGLGAWGGTGLLARLLDKLTADEPTVELYVHAVWALIRARPWVVEGDPALTDVLTARVEALCDAAEVPQQTRRELDNVRYGLGLRRPAAATTWTS